ncbi:hypothetical protein ACJIZ3_011897 [Penstemon smallii]|uniref:Pentatricopeptide repeat-containing protein n=1 Tax=Penstemon smallii TaxID=265156 RepID=A0ABD3UP13_9LAMI
MKKNVVGALFSFGETKLFPHKMGVRVLQAVSIHHSFDLFSVNLHTSVSHKGRSYFPPKPIIFDFNSINKVEDVICIFRDMLRRRPLPYVIHFNKSLTSVVKMKQYSIALLLFDEMRQLGVPAHDYTMNIAINCYCLLNRVDFGFSILCNFFKCGIQPNVTTFNTLIKGLFLEDRVFEAEKLFKKLLRERLCEPNEITFLIVVNGLCKAGHTLTAFDLVMLLEKGRSKPNVRVYTTLIDSLCKDRMVNDALYLLSNMIKEGTSPDIITYNSMIKGLCDSGRFGEVKDLLKEMVTHKISPDLFTFNTLVDAFCKEGRVEDAEDMLEIMNQRSISPNVVTYNALIDGYCLRGEMDKARKIFHTIL